MLFLFSIMFYFLRLKQIGVSKLYSNKINDV